MLGAVVELPAPPAPVLPPLLLGGWAESPLLLPSPFDGVPGVPVSPPPPDDVPPPSDGVLVKSELVANWILFSEYEATATINAYDSDGETLIGVSAAKLIITVEN